MVYDLIIVGAGAAGLFAAANVAPGRRVLVLEKGPSPGRKLLLTGNGQCNLTHGGKIRDFLPRYGGQGKRLRPVLFPFSNLALMDRMEALGVPLFTREDGKVFPKSLDAREVLRALLDEAGARGVRFHYDSPVTGVTPLPEGGPGRFFLEADTGYRAQSLLIATGGASCPPTGSDGSFFRLLEGLGIPVTPLRPALVPVLVEDYPYGELSGVTLPDCGLTLPGGAANRARGSLLMTHRGFSGPLILDNSRYLSPGDTLAIHVLPDRDAPGLRRELLEAVKGEDRRIVTLLEARTGLPRRLLDTICRRAEISPEVKASRLSGRELERLAALLAADRYRVAGTAGFGASMVTAGGVCLDGVDLATMESRQYPGLYFAGEVLDVDGDTGGFNLQFAFSSAHLAAKAVNLTC